MTNRDVLHAPADLRGFTLVELMVTVAIVAILMAVGVPQLISFLKKQQVAADIESLSASIRLARSEALKRSGTVSICPLAAGSTNACVANATSTSWSNGWIVFIDYGTQGVYEPNTGGTSTGADVLLKTEQTVRSGTIATTTGNLANLTFMSNGISTHAATSFLIGDKCLAVAITGKTRVSDPVNNTCP